VNAAKRRQARSDTQQHPETLHIQADQEQVEEVSLGIGARLSLNDYTTEEDFVKYLYSMALGIEEFERLTTANERLCEYM
jgi:hypothetical protein